MKNQEVLATRRKIVGKKTKKNDAFSRLLPQNKQNPTKSWDFFKFLISVEGKDLAC